MQVTTWMKPTIITPGRSIQSQKDYILPDSISMKHSEKVAREGRK
jgi:hypothetical protein